MTAKIGVAITLSCFLISTAGAQNIGPAPKRGELYRALVAARAFHPDRLLVHLSHTCNLRLDGQYYPIVDVQELIKGAVTPSGVNQILVLDAKLKIVHKTTN